MTLDAAYTDYLEEPAAQANLSSRLIRIHPRRIISWNIDPAQPGLQAHDLRDSQ
jgi:hypothetical protein